MEFSNKVRIFATEKLQGFRIPRRIADLEGRVLKSCLNTANYLSLVLLPVFQGLHGLISFSTIVLDASLVILLGGSQVAQLFIGIALSRMSITPVSYRSFVVN